MIVYCVHISNTHMYCTVDLGYSSMTWNDEILTLLCPVGGEEPYLAIPELIQKVYTATHEFIYIYVYIFIFTNLFIY